MAGCVVVGSAWLSAARSRATAVCQILILDTGDWPMRSTPDE